MNKFDLIGDLNVNLQPIPTSYVGGMSFYESLSNLLGFINNLISSNNIGADEILELKQKKQSIEDYLTDIAKRKLDSNGNFTGTWNGLELHQSDLGLSSDWNSSKGTFPTVSQRLDNFATNITNVSSSLEKITKFKLLADIPNTEYKTGDSVDYGYIRNRNEYLYGELYRKLFTGENVQICCMGDSLTNGQDTTSIDIREVSQDLTHVTGEVTSTQTIAGTTYPEALQLYLQQIYGTRVKVINRGYSGDWVKSGYEHYPNQHSSDVTIIMYGTNDSRASWVESGIVGNVEMYINWYEQLIIREILWGKTVFILTPPKLRNANDTDIKTFTIALNALGEKYSIPVINTVEFTANYPYTIFSDEVHHNSNGYKLFASKVFATFIGEGAKKPNIIGNGSILLTRPNVDNLQYFGSSVFGNTSTQTPTENVNSGGSVAYWQGLNSGVIYSFYTEENDMMVIPLYWSSNGNCRLTLDNATVSPHNINDLLVDQQPSFTENNIKQVVYNTVPIPTLSDFIKADDNTLQLPIIRVVEKGWHTLKVDNTLSDSQMSLTSLYFLDYRTFKQEKEILSAKQLLGFYMGYTHSTYSDTPPSVTSTVLKIDDLNNVLGKSLDGNLYFKNPTLKITVNNYDNSIIEYGFTIPQYDGLTNGTFAFWLIGRHNLVTTPTERTIDTMTIDRTNNTITINWTGTTTKISNFCIKPL